MKLFHVVFLLCSFQMGFAQSSSYTLNGVTEQTSELDKFEMHIDSIEKYVYRDASIAELASQECEKIMDGQVQLPDSTIFEYVLQKIFLKHSQAKPLEAYKVIADTERSLDSLVIKKTQLGRFQYLQSFTYMSIGDLEEAQASYYQNLEIAEIEKDTQGIARNLFSLGQLYNDEGEYESAEKYLTRLLTFQYTYSIRPSTLSMFNLELSESYDGLEEYEKAIKSQSEAIKIARENDLQILLSDALIRKGRTLLALNDVAKAEKIYDEVSNINKMSIDENVMVDTKRFQADLFRKQNQHEKALLVYKNLLTRIDTNNRTRILETYKNAHEVCNILGDYKNAHTYLLKHSAIKQKIEDDASKQESSYLKIKFESEEKERENKILNAQLLQNKAERKLMYLWLALSLLVLSILFIVYYQIKRYSRNLEEEVLQRTQNLNESNIKLDQTNQELKEYNRILAHDLKEPLRNIIGFSQLANNKIKGNTDAENCLEYVISGGKQLEKLIDSVNVFQNESMPNQAKLEEVNVQQVIDKALKKVEGLHPEKTIKLHFPHKPTVISDANMLESVFYILFDNAIKFNKNNLATIQVNYQLIGDVHSLEIEDNGIGIDAKYHDQIFNMFKRLNDRKNYDGAGMGLSIAKKTLEKINGDITLSKSVENKGSIFVISFPNLKLEPTQKVV